MMLPNYFVMIQKYYKLELKTFMYIMNFTIGIHNELFKIRVCKLISSYYLFIS